MSATVTLNPGNVWVSTPYGKVKEAVTYKYKTEFKATCVFYLSVLLGSASGCGPISVKHRHWSPKNLKKHIHEHMTLYYRKKIIITFISKILNKT